MLRDESQPYYEFLSASLATIAELDLLGDDLMLILFIRT